jgi:hypothetical protein
MTLKLHVGKIDCVRNRRVTRKFEKEDYYHPWLAAILNSGEGNSRLSIAKFDGTSDHIAL